MSAYPNGAAAGPSAGIESTHARLRLAVALVLGTIGSIGMWSFVAALQSLYRPFIDDRATARALSMKSDATGFGVRFFRVATTIGLR